MYNRYKHHRKSNRLKSWDYSKVGAYFVTICVKNRECLFGNIHNNNMILNEYGKIVHQFWYSLVKKYTNIDLDEFVVMPNHVHGIIIIKKRVDDEVESKNKTRSVGAIHELPLPNDDNQNPGYSQTNNDYKNLPDELNEFTKYIIKRRRMLLSKIVGYYQMNTSKIINHMRDMKGNSMWQRNYYDEIIRDPDHFMNVRRYIRNNPKNWTEDENNPVNIKKVKSNRDRGDYIR